MKIWEKEKQRLRDVLLQGIASRQEQVRVLDVRNQGYPEAFEALARLYAERRFGDENPIRIEEGELFDIRESETQRRLHELQETLVLTRVLSKGELQQIAESAISLGLDILVRPRQTLLEKLFDSAESQQIADLLTVLSGFGEERPFIQKLIQELEESEAAEISQEDFVKLAANVETQVYKQTPISAFMADIDLMLKFEGAVTGETHFVVKSDILLGLLKERGLAEMGDALSDEAESKDFWTPDEIENALERFILVGFEDEESEEHEVEHIDATTEERDVGEHQEVLDFRLPEENSKQKHEPVTELSSKRSPEQPFSIQFADTVPETDVLEDEEPAEEDEEPLQQHDETYPSLFELIDSDDRHALVEKIFDNDAAEYTRFIHRLDDTTTWRDAKNIIDDELKNRNIHPNSHEAVLLGDILFSRYHSKSGG